MNNHTHIRDAISTCLSYSASPMDYIKYSKENLEKINQIEGEIDPILIGIELEVATSYPTREIVAKQETPFFILKSDSTISGNKSHFYEMVTIPMSFAAQKKHWAAFFEKVDYARFDTSTSTNNGMHVHVGRSHLEDYHLKNLAWFFANPDNKEFIRLISERDDRSFSQWCGLPSTTHSSNIKAYKNAMHDIRSMGKYCALNISSSGKPTIEFRLFKGIVSFAEMVKNLDFVQALLTWTHDPMFFTEVTVDNFFNYLQNSPKNRFIALKEFLENSEYDPNKSKEEVNLRRDLIKIKSQPVRIISYLTRNNINVDKHLIHTINSLTGKYKFFMTTKGDIDFYDSSMSRLHKKNEDFANRYLGKLRKPSTSI